MYNFRTDLALERKDVYQKANKLKQVNGVSSTEENIDNNIKVSRVMIETEEGEQALGKPKGNYVTIDIKNLKIAR